MLTVDDNMFKLAKMQEALLKVSCNNREENLKKYKDIVIEIDRRVCSEFLNELELVDNHNQTLEEELKFLQEVKEKYDQLSLMQLNFRNVCEMYGDKWLHLSNLSVTDIEYIEHRISVLNGYLINLKNIDINQKKLQEFNDKLVVEEKNNVLLRKKLLDFEELLVSNFMNAEGRSIVDGKLQYISVLSEYKDLGYDFKLLISNVELLKELLDQICVEKTEIEEKRKTAEICYNSNPSVESKQILDDISKDFFSIRYRLTMLKILDLLSKSYSDYELFKEKREKLLDLIKYRIICLKNLGGHISIDPFSRTKIEEQLNTLKSVNDNSKVISRITKEMSLLSERVDLMIEENKKYKEELNENKKLIVDTVSMSDVVDRLNDDFDILGTVLIKQRLALDNQVVSIKDVLPKFNMLIVKQKTNSVIKRVYQMVNRRERKKNVNISNNSSGVVPDLVIVSPSMNTDVLEKSDRNKTEELPFDLSIEDTSLVVVDVKDNVIPVKYNESMFETVDPFVQAPMFFDKTDEETEFIQEDKIESLEVEKIDEDNKVINELGDLNLDEQMPDAFWVTQESEEVNKNEENVISFDEQIAELMSSNEDGKIKKLVA